MNMTAIEKAKGAHERISNARDQLTFIRDARRDDLDLYQRLTHMIGDLYHSLEALAALEAEKPAEDLIEELPCVHCECTYYDTDFTDSCAAESGGEPASATCVKHLKSSHLIQQYAEAYHAKKCAECKAVHKNCENCAEYPCEAVNNGMFCEGKNWKNPNDFPRFEKRSGITTDVNDDHE